MTDIEACAVNSSLCHKKSLNEQPKEVGEKNKLCKLEICSGTKYGERYLIVH